MQSSDSEMVAPTGKGGTFVGLFVSFAIAVAAAIAARGAEDSSSIAVISMAFLLVGPVAFGGLEFIVAQILALWSVLARHDTQRTSEPKEARDASPSAASRSSAAGPPSNAMQVKAESRKLPQAQVEELSAWGKLMQAWGYRPSFAIRWQTFVQKVSGVLLACANFPKGCCELWQLLTAPRWKPFPWRYLPDPLAFIWGVLELLFIAPILIVEIVVTVPTMALLQAEWRRERCAWLRAAVPELVRSVSRPLGRLMMLDARNHSYLPWMLLMGTLVPMMFFWALWRHMTFGFELSTLCIYHLVRVGPRFQLFAHAHTLCHKEGHAHRGLFKGIWRILNVTCEWWIGPFYGVVPWNYYLAHMKIHHRWHNDVDDVHTNLDLDRTKFLSFLLYTPRFTLYWTGLSPLALFIKRGEWALVTKLLYGMVAYYGVMAAMLWWNPVFCMGYWIFPHAESCVGLCAISYLWHAFVEESDPGNQYVNSVTILDGHDNVWNEDYHVVHHHAPNTHWSDAPAHFEAHREKYAAVTATIFQDTEQGKLLEWLFSQNWDAMAEHFVDLTGKLSHEEKRKLIVRRLSVVVGESGRDGKRKEWAANSTIRDFEE